MPIAIGAYNHTAKLFLNGDVAVDSTVFRVVLLSDAAAFDPTHTQLSQVTNAGSYEISGAGWPVDGPALTGVAVTTIETSNAMLDADDVAVTATGGSIGTAYYAVLYKAGGDDPPLYFIDFGGGRLATDGNDFQIPWSPTGIVKMSLAS